MEGTVSIGGSVWSRSVAAGLAGRASRRWRVATLVVCGLVGPLLLPAGLGGPPPLRAADPQAEAARYFSLGNAAYDSGDYEEAVRMFRVCLALAPDLSGPQRRLGQALKRTGHCEEALDHYLAYLRQKPTGTYSDEIRQEMADCAAQTDGTPGAGAALASATLRLSIGLDGATVKVDGVEMGESPLPPLTLKAGTHSILVSNAGFFDAERTVVLAGGEEQELAIPLEQRPEPPPVAPAPSAPSRLELTVVPSGARVLIDGTLVGLSPLTPQALEPGPHLLQVTKIGFLPQELQLLAAGGAPIVSEVRLTRQQGAGPLDELAEHPGGPDHGPAATAAVGGGVGGLAAGADSGAPRWLTWTTLGLGGACLVSGAVLGGLSLSRAAEYGDAGPGSDRRSLKESGEAMALGADVLGGVGLALLVGGVALYVVQGSAEAALADAGRAGPPTPANRGAVSTFASPGTWRLLVGPGSVALGGRF